MERERHQGRQSTEKESNQYPGESRAWQNGGAMETMRLQNRTLQKEAVCDPLGSLHTA